MLQWKKAQGERLEKERIRRSICDQLNVLSPNVSAGTNEMKGKIMELEKFLSFFPSFFLSYLLFLSLSTYSFQIRRLLFHLIALSDTQTLGRTPLDEGSARHIDLYRTTHNIHKRQTSMPPPVFETAIPANERPQTHALDRGATGIGQKILMNKNQKIYCLGFYV